MMNTETRDAAAKVVQDVIKERTAFGIGIGVIREALDTAFPITVTPTNPAPVIETANGAVDLAPNPAHHTTRRIAELEKRVDELDKELREADHNLGTHRHLSTGHVVFDFEDEYPEDDPRGDDQQDDWEKIGANIDAAIENASPPQPTPPAAPDEDALWEQVVSAWARAMGNHPHPVDARGVRADVYAAKAAVAKAVELGLMPTPKIEVYHADVEAVVDAMESLPSSVYGNTRVRVGIEAFARRKNGGA